MLNVGSTWADIKDDLVVDSVNHLRRVGKRNEFWVRFNTDEGQNLLFPGSEHSDISCRASSLFTPCTESLNFGRGIGGDQTWIGGGLTQIDGL